MFRPGKLSYLEDFEKLWKILKKNFSFLRKVFYYLESSYLRSTCVGSLEKLVLYYLIENMSCAESMSLSLIQQIINQVMLLRDGKEVNFEQINNLIELLSFTQIYKQAFEGEYVKLSASFFKANALNFSENFEIHKYLDFITRSLQEETQLSEKIMLSDQRKKQIFSVLEEELITNNIKKMLEFGFVTLIETMDFEYLKLFYLYFQKVDKLDFLKTNLSDYIKKIGSHLISSKTENLISDIIVLRKKMLAIVEKSFENSKKIKLSVDYAFQFFINLKTNDIAEITSKYVDDLLKKQKNKMSDEQNLMLLLEEAFEIFRNLLAKDIFEAFYTKRLIRRLLMGVVFSDDLENYMINKLAEGILPFLYKTFFFFKECGHSYTKQMEEIFKDINISKQLNEDFQNFLKKRNLYKEKFDIYFTVIHSNSWPFSNSSLPKLMEPVFIYFIFFRF